MISSERLDELLDRFRSLTIGLVGDLFLDRYLRVESDVHELSVETGLPAHQVSQIRNSPGALGTVINNLAALGVGNLIPATVIGDDGHGFDLMQTLKPLPVDVKCVIRDPQRLTPTYMKPIRQESSGAWRELNRLDVRTRRPIDSRIRSRVREHVRQLCASTDGLIVLDQVSEDGWGVVDGPLRTLLAELAFQLPKKLMLVDSRCHLAAFRQLTLKGNQRELLAAVPADEAKGSPGAAARYLAERTEKPVFATLGAGGILVARPDGSQQHLPGVTVAGPVDIVGAGDAATAGIVTALLSGASDTEAAVIGNLTASVTVQQSATTGTASPDQLRAQRALAYQ